MRPRESVSFGNAILTPAICPRWPARFEELQPSALGGGRLLLDVAHNEPAIRALVESVCDAYADAKVVVILGANRDKDLAAIVR